MDSENMTVQVFGRTVNLATVLPIKIRDWRKLRERGITPKSINENPSIEQTADLIGFILSLADSSITQDMVDNCTIQSPEIQAIITAIKASDQEAVDRPT